MLGPSRYSRYSYATVTLQLGPSRYTAELKGGGTAFSDSEREEERWRMWSMVSEDYCPLCTPCARPVHAGGGIWERGQTYLTPHLLR